MKTAAISELKALLGKYLSRVKAGEEVVITERGKPIARILPIVRTCSSVHLAAMERAGLVSIGRGRLPDGFRDVARPKDPKDRALAALLEEREESR